MRHYRSELPLGRDQAGRFLPWLVALMVYLAALAVAGVAVIEGAVASWDRELSGTLTVYISAPAEPLPAAERDARTTAALEVLRASPGITRAEALSPARIAGLLEPWLGAGGLARELPLPTLIDASLSPDAAVDLEALRARLAARVPGAAIDDNGMWLAELLAFARMAEAVALVIVLLIGLVAVAAVVFVTRTGLAVHHEVVEVLHLIGARDGYVARQFERQALALSLKGGLGGFAAAIVTLVLMGRLGAPAGVSLLPPLALSAGQWASLALVPLGAGAIAMLTARLTVLRTLAAMP